MHELSITDTRDGTTRAVPIALTPLTIGSDVHCDLILPSPEVAPRHCRIEGDAEGRLWFSSGAPVHAETKGQVGFDAALHIVNATAGAFTFEPSAELPSPTIEASVTQLLLEASRHLDEGLL